MAKGVNFTFKATNAAKGAMQEVQRGLQGVQRQTNATRVAQRSLSRSMGNSRRVVQQLGFQFTDLFTQIGSGQSAMVAFTQQGGQALQIFGALGAVMATVLTIFGAIAIAFSRSGRSLSELLPLFGVLEGTFVTIGQAISRVSDLMLDFANVVVNNLDRILVTAGLVATLMAGRWVAAFVAARVATFSLVGALVALRTAVIRTGIGGIILLAGELVFRFIQLVQSVGGFSNALSMLKDVAVEVFNRIVDSFAIVPLGIQAGANRMVAFFIGALNRMLGQFIDFTWAVADGFNELFGGIGIQIRGMNATVTQQLASTMLSFEDAANSATESISGIVADVTAPLESVNALRDAVKAVDDIGKQIDVRDWFGGSGAVTEDSGSGGGSGSRSPSGTAKAEADRIKQIFNDTQRSISDSLSQGFKALLDGSKSFGDAASDILGSIANRVIDILTTPIFNSIAGSLAGSIFGGLGGIGASFDGGGFTGAGVRAGGLDGKGGRMAMVHPNETVVDHTKGQSMGERNVIFNIQTPDAESFKRSQRQLARQAKAALG